jgi:hypothetical protein
MTAELMLINPRRKRRHRRARVTHARRNPRRRRRMSALQEKYFGKRHRRVIRARRNPRRRHHRRHYTIMRRNPSELSSNPVGFVSSTIVPAAVGAIGGVGVNYIFDNYAPASLQTGILNPLSRFALAALLGMGVGAVTDNRTGAMVAAGAMTVTAYDMITNFMNGQGVFAQTGQQGYGQQGGYGQGQMGRIVNRRMGRIVNRGMGYMNPSRQLSRFV